MNQDQKLDKILELIQENQVSLQENQAVIQEIQVAIQENRLAIQENQLAIGETREIIDFLKDEMVTRDEFESKLTEFKNEILTHVDGLAVQQKTFEVELVALRVKSDRHEEYIQQLAKPLNIQLQI